MLVCYRCGAELYQKDEYCSVCGLHRRGGKGRISSRDDNKTSTIDNKPYEIPDKIKLDKIWKYYDLGSLTQEKVDTELIRLHKEIEELESALIHMERNEPGHPDKGKFYEERIKLTKQLDTIYDFLSEIEHEKLVDFIRNGKLKTMYGKLPEWRVKELKEKRSQKYYHLKSN